MNLIFNRKNIVHFVHIFLYILFRRKKIAGRGKEDYELEKLQTSSE